MSPRRRKGKGPPGPKDLWSVLYPTLDLHGLTAGEASSSSRAWLQQRQSSGETTVRLITGRGLHSQGLPVLPAEIEALLHQLKDTLVADYEREPGGGVYRVRLKNPPAPAARPPEQTVRHDPAIIRQAEEALAELGVAASPALLQAEIARIVKEHREKRE